MLRPNICDAIRGGVFFLCFYHGKQLELAELSSAVTFVGRRDLLDVLDVIRRGA